MVLSAIALLGAYTRGRKTINLRIAELAAREVLPSKRRPLFLRPVFWMSATMILLLGFGIRLFQHELPNFQAKFGVALNPAQIGEAEANTIAPIETVRNQAVSSSIVHEITDNQPPAQVDPQPAALAKIYHSDKRKNVEHQTFAEFIRDPKLDVDTAFAQLFTKVSEFK